MAIDNIQSGKLNRDLAARKALDEKFLRIIDDLRSALKRQREGSIATIASLQDDLAAYKPIALAKVDILVKTAEATRELIKEKARELARATLSDNPTASRVIFSYIDGLSVEKSAKVAGISKSMAYKHLVKFEKITGIPLLNRKVPADESERRPNYHGKTNTNNRKDAW